MLEYPPPACPVDDAPFTSCHTQEYHVDATGRIHPGKGGIVIRQTPMRDEAAEAEAGGAPELTVPLTAPGAPPPPRRTRRAR